MPLEGEYEPSPNKWVEDQVQLYERTGGAEGNHQPGGDLPVVILTSVGARSGKIRKTPVMRVEHDGDYAVVASLGGAPKNPVWYYNLKSEPRVELQDGPEKWDMVARELSGPERERWWARAVEAYPPYAEYQTKTDRVIPVFVVEAAGA
ncbi:nitroreductase family deazaflavin-dependent oxidoreductase [Streptomyces sp. NPDC004610]|uniref:nitroreductase family deazaflavin-dependent oxidoreductase n=1 Tax=unclassified Streptomyces TaxID=2593676 RepID=UPI0033AB08DE